jgi:glucose/arabinose dehydrogenase
MHSLKISTRPVLLSILFFLLVNINCGQAQQKSWTFKSEHFNLKAEVIADGITIPFGMAFLPDGRLLVTDRSDGKILIVDPASGAKTTLKNVPKVHGKDQAGMMDIILHPAYADNGWIYFSYSGIVDGGNTTMVERAKIKGDALTDRAVLFTSAPKYKNGAHYGSRLAIKDGYLFITVGERYSLKDSAQLLGNTLGKIIRVHDDGRIPADNPFVNRPGARPEVWSYGHRNPQGLAIHPRTGELWESEHGPQGGDEINLVSPGKNYGWPVITYGIDYSGMPIGDGITQKEGMEQPIHYYKPSIGTSGLMFYSGDVFSEWNGNLFVGGLALTHLNRLEIKNNKVVHEERLFKDRGWRVRCIRQGPDGLIYLGVDGGMIVKISRAN